MLQVTAAKERIAHVQLRKNPKMKQYIIYNEAPYEIFAKIEIPEENTGYYLNARKGKEQCLRSKLI